MPINAFAEVSPILATVVFVPADGTTSKTLQASQPTTWRLDTIICVNDDAIAHVVNLNLIDATGGAHGIGSVQVAANAGTGTTPSVDLLGTLFPADQVGIAFPAGWSIQASLSVAAVVAVGLVGYGGYF